MKEPSSIIFACLISRTHFIARRRRHRSRRSPVVVAAASCVTVVAHANMPGRGDVISGVSFFAACTYHWRARGEERAAGEREKKKKEREGEKKIVLARLRCSRRCECACTRVHVYITWSHTRDRCNRRGEYVRRVRGAFRRMPAPIADGDTRNCDRVTRAYAHNASRPAALYRRTATETREVSGTSSGSTSG